MAGGAEQGLAIAGLTASRIARVRAALLAFGIGLVVVVWGVPWPCPVAMLARVPCPGCGMSRALREALGCRFAEAFRFHPLWPLVILTGLLFLAVPRVSRWGGVALAFVFVVVWLARFFGALGGPVAI